MYDEYEREVSRDNRKMMAEVRSARGNGKRKKEKARSEKIRRGGEAASARLDIAATAYAKKASIELNKKSLRQLESMIKGLFPQKAISRNAFAFWRYVDGNSSKFSVRKADLKYLEAITVAYAIYNYIRASGELSEHIKAIYERVKSPSYKKIDLLKSVLELVVDYSGYRNDEKKLNRSAISRDALAVQWLIKSNVAPHEAVAYQSECGGGVDQWSRLMSKNAGLPAEAPKAASDAIENDRDYKAATKRAANDAYDDDEPLSNGGNWAKTAISKTHWDIAVENNLEHGDVLVLAYIGNKDTGAELLGSHKILFQCPPGLRRIRVKKLLAPIKAAAIAQRGQR